MPFRRILAGFLAAPVVLAAVGCDTGEAGPGDVQGLVVVQSDAGEASAARLDEAIEESATLHAVAHVDFPGEGASPAARMVLFSHPYLVARLLEADPRAGLDLPFGILAFERDGRTHIAYDAPDYLARRYRLEGVAPSTLDNVGNVLREAASAAAGGAGRPAPDARFVREGDGVVTVPVEGTAAAAYDRLIAALEDDPTLTPAALFDFSRDAAAHGLRVRYARLVVFESAALTAPLLAAAPTVAVDLPLKLLVTLDDEGAAFVAYDDPFYLAERHGIEGAGDALAGVRAVLDRLAAAAATPGGRP